MPHNQHNQNNKMFALLLLIQLLFAVNAFSLRLIPFRLRTPSRLMMSVPLELEGQLDPTKSWEVKLIFDGKEKVVNVPEDCSMLEAGEKVFDGVNSSCRNGVCTTCSGQVVEGRENTLLAVHGLGAEQVALGYVCTCQCYATGPGVVVKLGMYDEVYELQYGRFEKSYEMKYGKKEDEPKKKNFLGF